MSCTCVGRVFTNCGCPVHDPAKRQCIADRQTGFMPSHVQEREDGDELWTAFMRARGTRGYEGQQLRYFIAGWDAAHRD